MEHQNKREEGSFLRALGKQNPTVAFGDSSQREEKEAVTQVRPSDKK